MYVKKMHVKVTIFLPANSRKFKSIGDEHRCGSYTVWLQTDSNEKLLKYHNMGKGKVRHLGDKSVEFSVFLSCKGAHNITLRSDSCICDACYRDCLWERESLVGLVCPSI